MQLELHTRSSMEMGLLEPVGQLWVIGCLSESCSTQNSIGTNCETAFGVPNNSPNDTAILHDALARQADIAGVPRAFALAIMMQESLGCVFVDTTFGSVSNPGLMQDHDGFASCAGKSHCPPHTIESMLHQGLCGTSSGAGIQQCYAQAHANGRAQRWYQAARIYNSGSLVSTDLTSAYVGNPCYTSDVANRLIGWTSGPSQCTATN